MNIERILNCLVPEYEIKRPTSKTSSHININIPKSILYEEETFESFFKYLMFIMSKDYNIELDEIKEHIAKYEYLDTLNKKKISYSIENNSLNNVVKLFLAMYYDINIFVYHENSKILKSYYAEEQMMTSKNCALFFYDNIKEQYSVMTECGFIPYTFIQENFPNVLTVAIGLTLDKVFSTTDKYSSFSFVTGEVSVNDDWINEDNIIRRKPVLELFVPRTYDWRTFDVSTLKSFNPKKLLLELYSLKK